MVTRRTSSELEQARTLIRDHASRQCGIFRRGDLVAWGFDPSMVLTMLRNGSWVRLHHGVFADAESVRAATDPVARHALVAAATVAAIPAGLALWGPSAAAVLGLPFDRNLVGQVHLVRPRGADSRALRRRITALEHLPTAIVHVLDLPDGLIATAGGLPVVVPEVAACGTAMVSDRDWSVVPLDAVAWRDESARDRLSAIAERWPRLAGAGNLRAALPLVRSGAQSPLETLSRLRITRCGLEEPTLQVPISDRDGLIGYVDMLFEEFGVIGEADGEVKYVDRRAVIAEKWREDRLRATGRPVVRWGWREVMGSMEEVADRIRRGGLRRRAS